MAVHYRLNPGESRFTVQAFASGLLSFLGHSPTFAIRDGNMTSSLAGAANRSSNSREPHAGFNKNTAA
jgi:hypothetical protein